MIADVLSEVGDDERSDRPTIVLIATKLSDQFIEDNERFDVMRFMQAATGGRENPGEGSPIDTVADLDEILEQGPYAWPGGYPLYFVTADGAALSFETVRDEYDEVAEAITGDETSGGWRVVAVAVNWEDPDLYDDHSGDRIESAYAEDDDE